MNEMSGGCVIVRQQGGGGGGGGWEEEDSEDCCSLGLVSPASSLTACFLSNTHLPTFRPFSSHSSSFSPFPHVLAMWSSVVKIHVNIRCLP